MSAEMVSEHAGTAQPGMRARAHALHQVVGVLDDGTPYYAPVGEIAADGSRVICHLCGRALRSVVAHLPSHGWTKEQYCLAFGLERGQSLEGSETNKLGAALFTARLALDPAVRAGAAAGRQRARDGELGRAAAAAGARHLARIDPAAEEAVRRQSARRHARSLAPGDPRPRLR